MAAEPPVPGQRFELHVADLPAPFATESASNPSLIRPSRAAILAAPPGFVVNVFAEGLDHARNMVVLPDGTVFLAQPRLGEVSLLRDADGDGVADVIGPFVTGLLRPHGLALHGDYLYVADMDFVRRYDLRGPGVDGEILTAPGALGPPTSGPSSHSMPSHLSDSSISSTEPLTSRPWSVSSILTMNVPPRPRANSQLYIAVRIMPTWGLPVGLGANLTRT